MYIHSEPLMSWLRRQRAVVALELDMMAYRFDLDGALDADQEGLAWVARRGLLATAVEIHVRGRGIGVPDDASDAAERLCLVMEALTRADGPLADAVWEWLEKPAAQTRTQAMEDAETALRFMAETLAVPAAQSRDAAVRAWADAVRLLREVAQGLGLAGTDSWYLADGDEGAQLDWYDQVLSQLSTAGSEA